MVNRLLVVVPLIPLLGFVAIARASLPRPFVGTQFAPGHRLQPALIASPAEPSGADVGTGADTKPFIELDDVQALIGKEVRSSTGDKLGRICNILVDRTGRVRAAVIDFGGFLGVGIRKLAVDWEMLRFVRHDIYESITLNLTRDQINDAPAYNGGQRVVVIGASDEAPPAQ